MMHGPINIRYAKTVCVCQCTSDVTAIMVLREVKSYSGVSQRHSKRTHLCIYGR